LQSIKNHKVKILEPLKSEAITTYKRLILKGMEESIAFCVISAFKNGKSALEISDLIDLPLEQVKTIIEEYLKSEPLKS
jgi:hypothetical protein